MTRRHETITMTIEKYCEYMREHNLVPIWSQKTPPGEFIWWELPKDGKRGDPLEAHIMVRPFDYHVDVGG